MRSKHVLAMEFRSDSFLFGVLVTPHNVIPCPLSPERFFANKLWNAGRFLLGNLKDLGEEERQRLAVGGPMSAEEVGIVLYTAAAARRGRGGSGALSVPAAAEGVGFVCNAAEAGGGRGE